MVDLSSDETHVAIILSQSGDVLQRVCKSTEQQAWIVLKRMSKYAPKGSRAALRKESST